MNTAIATTLISVLGAGLFAGLYGMLFHYLRDVSTRLASLDSSIKNMDTKFTAQLQDNGERLARIEAKLDIDPPPKPLSSFAQVARQLCGWRLGADCGLPLRRPREFASLANL